jgi:hypothetical protein
LRAHLKSEISQFETCTIDEYQAFADADDVITRDAALDALEDTLDDHPEMPVRAWVLNSKPVRNYRSSIGNNVLPELVSVELLLSVKPRAILTISATEFEVAELSVSSGKKTVTLGVRPLNPHEGGPNRNHSIRVL